MPSLHIHTTTGVTAIGLMAPGNTAAVESGVLDSTGQLPPMNHRRSSAGHLAASGGAGAGASTSAAAAGGGAPVLSSSLGRMMGAPSNATPIRNHSGAILRSTPDMSPTAGSPSARRSALVGLAPAGSSAGGAAAAATALAAAVGGRPGSRAMPRETPPPPRKIAAMDNIAEALGRFFQARQGRGQGRGRKGVE